MPGPLHGFMVIDLTSMVSGPLATQTLADQGADVIKVEAPRGDHARHGARRRGGFSASFLNNNRNKRSVVLDLKHPDGLAAFRRLARAAEAGRLHHTRSAARFSVTEPEHRRGAPVLGAHTREVLSEHGFDRDAIAALEASGAAVQAGTERG